MEKKFTRFIVSFFEIIASIIILLISFKIFSFLISLIGAFVLMAFDIHVSENQRALGDLEASANIGGFIIGSILLIKSHKWMVKRRTINKDDLAP